MNICNTKEGLVSNSPNNKSESHLDALLIEFEFQLQRNNGLIGSIYNSVNKLLIIPTDPNDPIKEEKAIGSLERLNMSIQNLRRNNNSLENIASHLQNCI